MRFQISFASTFFLFLFSTPALGAVEKTSDFSAAMRVLWGLLVVFGVLLIIYVIAKKRMSFLHSPGKGIIKIIETRHLMPKQTLYLIEVRDREFLIAAGGDRVQLIAPIDNRPDESFNDILEQTTERGGSQ